MKKKKYVFSLMVLIISMFLLKGNVVYGADTTVTWVDDNAKFLTNCSYHSEDNKTVATYAVYKSSGFFTSSIVGDKPITLMYWNDDNVNIKIDDVSGHEESLVATIYLKNSCPKYLTVRRVKAFPGYKNEAAAFFDKKEAKNYFKDGDVILYLDSSSNDTNTIKQISKVNNYFFRDYIRGQGGHKYDEGRYWCDYKDVNNTKYSVPFSSTFADAMKSYGSGFGSFLGRYDENQKLETTDPLACPQVLYKIEETTRNGNDVKTLTADIYNISAWPEQCENDNVKCTKYTEKGEPVAYKKADENNPVNNGNIEGTYYYYNETIDLAYKSTKAELKVSSQDGKISNLYLMVDNERAFFAAPSDEDLSNYFLKILKDGAGLPDKLFCDSASSLTENGLKATSTIANNTPNKEFDGLYCYLDYNMTGKQYSYFSVWVKDIENYKNTVNAGYDIGIDFDDECKDKNSEECLKYQDEQYKKAQKLVDECRRIYVDSNSTKEDIQNCDDLNGLIETWAKAGYFGNRIITSNTSGNTCDQTLGSLGDWLTKIFKIMLLAVPVIIMVFGFKDFIKALLSGKDDELKKSGSNFIKRLIFGAVFVALPMLIKVILTIALGGNFADICIL